MAPALNPCITGYGIVCGLEVHVNDDCSIEVQAGSAITSVGQVLHLQRAKKFHHYNLLTEPISHRAKVIQDQLKIKTCYELSDATFNAQTMDSLKQQYQSDLPERAFLYNKILLLFAETDPNDGSIHPSFWLVPFDELARGLGIQSTQPLSKGLFGKVPTLSQVDPIEIDAFLRPVLRLKSITVPRFGYKTLAIEEKSKGLKGNMVNPFTKIDSFQAIFSEYKAILDDLIPDFREVLELLHTHYSGLFTHKGSDYLNKFTQVLEAKWTSFCKQGEHLYYIQYFYDWLRDLVKAYDELRYALTDVRLQCICEELEGNKRHAILLLGPVQGGRSSHQPLLFRDALVAPFGQNSREAQLQNLKCLHWRLMMMIWTFDLPFLYLDEVLLDFGFNPGNEEKFDSSNYWESFESADKKTQIDNVPIKIIPTQVPYSPLEQQAIPYYYPLDSDSPYSVHRYWNPHLAKVHRVDELRSYNAHLKDPQKPSTDVANDSYSNRDEVLLPLAFDLQGYPYLKVEGHIGKKIGITGLSNTPVGFYFENINFLGYLRQHNICLDVIAVPLASPLAELVGLEHQQSLMSGQTLVLFYINKDNGETIQDLDECKKDPIIENNTVVADFVLPYRYACCNNNPSTSKFLTIVSDIKSTTANGKVVRAGKKATSRKNNPKP